MTRDWIGWASLASGIASGILLVALGSQLLPSVSRGGDSGPAATFHTEGGFGSLNYFPSVLTDEGTGCQYVVVVKGDAIAITKRLVAGCGG